MECTCVRHTELPHATKLFTDLTYHFDKVRAFYPYSPHDPESYAAAAKRVNLSPERRAALVSVLRQQNGPGAALDLLAKPGTVAVVTGQQVGLFSGPAYTIYKALTATRLARELSARGIPAVPVFWLATEDHDFAEVNHVWTFDKGQQPVRLKVEPPRETNGETNGRHRPVGGMVIDRPPLDELKRSLAGFLHADEVAAAVEEAYRPGVTMGAGFRALLAKLL